MRVPRAWKRHAMIFAAVALAAGAAVAVPASPTYAAVMAVHSKKQPTPTPTPTLTPTPTPSLTGTATGNDVSWPQCGVRLPQGQAFAIVGVNGGLANTSNPCFAAELAWAKRSTGGSAQPLVSLYVNTANPGDEKAQVSDWPTTGVTPYGQCSGADDSACAYQYGWDRAADDAQGRGVDAPASYTWWLDVETENSWSSSATANTAALEGMAAYLQGIGARVGVYSTASQWLQITGGSLAADSPLHGADSWLAGGGTPAGAHALCASPPLAAGGHVTLAQYIAKRLDADASCL